MKRTNLCYLLARCDFELKFSEHSRHVNSPRPLRPRLRPFYRFSRFNFTGKADGPSLTWAFRARLGESQREDVVATVVAERLIEYLGAGDCSGNTSAEKSPSMKSFRRTRASRSGGKISEQSQVEFPKIKRTLIESKSFRLSHQNLLHNFFLFIVGSRRTHEKCTIANNFRERRRMRNASRDGKHFLLRFRRKAIRIRTRTAFPFSPPRVIRARSWNFFLFMQKLSCL